MPKIKSLVLEEDQWCPRVSQRRRDGNVSGTGFGSHRKGEPLCLEVFASDPTPGCVRDGGSPLTSDFPSLSPSSYPGPIRRSSDPVPPVPPVEP